MNAVRIYAAGVLVSIILSALFFAPFLGLPVGAGISTGPSMGDDGPMVNVYADIEPTVGDIVIYETDGQLTNDQPVHRVVEETDRGLVTQGDANPYTDQEVDGVDHVNGGNTIGVVVFRPRAFDALIAWSAVASLLTAVRYQRK